MAKKVSSHRFDDGVSAIIKAAASQTGLSEADVLERCVIEKVVEVVSKHVQLQKLLQNPAVVKEFAKEVSLAKAAMVQQMLQVGPNSVPAIASSEADRAIEKVKKGQGSA